MSLADGMAWDRENGSVEKCTKHNIILIDGDICQACVKEKSVILEAGKNSDGKADGGKVRMSLLMLQFGKTLTSVASVLTFGAKKYPKPPLDDSWKDVPQARQRYADALYRHLHAALVLGEKVDQESGESHFSHAICNILFLANLKKGK